MLAALVATIVVAYLAVLAVVLYTDDKGAILFVILLPLAALGTAPWISLLLAVLIFLGLYFGLRRLGLQRYLVPPALIVAVVLTGFVSTWLHGGTHLRDVYYQIPVDVTMHPSDEALAAVRHHRWRAPSIHWQWSDVGRHSRGQFEWPARRSQQRNRSGGVIRSLAASSPLPVPVTARLSIRYRRKFIGYLEYRLGLVQEKITISYGRKKCILEIPVKAGKSELTP